MMQKRIEVARRRLALAASMTVAFGALALSPACGSEPSESSRASSRRVGSVELKLVMPNGETITSVGYSITNNGSDFKNGSIPVGDSDQITFQIGNIPTGTAYALSLSATTSGGTQCSSDAKPFSIMAHETTLVMMTLRCGGGGGPVASNNGNVRVDVDVEVGQSASCAVVDGVTAIPRSVRVGKSLSLTGFATVAGASFNWTVAPSTAGMFSAASAAMTDLTCQEVGTHTVTLSVSSGGNCAADTIDVPIICTPAEVAGSGGSGGAGAGGAGAGGESGAGAGGAGAGGESGAGAGGAGAGGAGAGGESGAGAGGAGAGGAGAGGAGAGGAGAGGAGAGGAGAGGAGAGGTGGTGGSGTPDGTSAECTACRDVQCREAYLGQGIDFVDGCFVAPVDGVAAPDQLPNYIQDCTDLVKCAKDTKCAGGANGLVDCYCGKTLASGAAQTLDNCNSTGPAPDAACVPAVQKAVRSTANADAVVRISLPDYPAGFAFFLLECDRTLCTTQCVPQ